MKESKRLPPFAIALLVALSGVSLGALCVVYVFVFDPGAEGVLTAFLPFVFMIGFFTTCFGIALGWASVLSPVGSRKVENPRSSANGLD